MGAVETLRARGNLTGSYVRPAGSDGVGPAIGTTVRFVLCQPVQDLLGQGKRLKWTNLGTIGNTEHLRRHGDHTAHSLGKMRGIVYAKDTGVPAGAKAALLKLCRTDDYDTRWIDFFNIGGRQYNYAGADVGSSGDQHLHISVREGSELTKVTLFDDIDAVMRGTFRKDQVPMPDVFNRLGFITGATLVKAGTDPVVWLVGRGRRAKMRDMTELQAVQAYMRSRGMQDGIITVESVSGEEV